jgi:predicted RNA binding protein YcfA (HicA-like mRNA interferase family)
MAHDSQFVVFSNKGKGGHRMIYHPSIEGEKRSCPIPFHGKTDSISYGVLKSIIRKFHLPADFFN